MNILQQLSDYKTTIQWKDLQKLMDHLSIWDRIEYAYANPKGCLMSNYIGYTVSYSLDTDTVCIISSRGISSPMIPYGNLDSTDSVGNIFTSVLRAVDKIAETDKESAKWA